MFRQISFINTYPHCCSSIAKLCETLQCHRLQHSRLPCPSLSPRICWNSCPLSQLCHPIISPSAAPFFCLQLFPASGSFPVSQLFTSGGQSIRASASASVLSMNIQDWFPLGWTGLISLQSKELSRVFSNTTIQKHKFFGTQPSFMVQFSHAYMTIRKTIALAMLVFVGNIHYRKSKRIPEKHLLLLHWLC